MDDLFAEMQQAADHAGDLIAVVISQASVLGVDAPQLLTDAAWELWTVARLPAATKVKGLRWPGLFVPAAGSREMQRRSFLAGALATAGAVLSEITTTPPTIATLARLRASTEGFRRARTADAMRTYLGPLLRHNQATDAAAQAAQDETLKRDLLVLHGDSLCLLGWCAIEAGFPTLARNSAGTAVTAARAAGHGDLAAYAFAQLALCHTLHLHDPHGALTLIDRGRGAALGGRWKTKAWLAANEAEAYSVLGDHRRTMAALDEAHVLFDGAIPPTDTPWLGAYGCFEDLDGFHGACAVRLGDTTAALGVLRGALDRRGADSPRVRSLLIDLGAAHALAREPEQACAALEDALTRVATQGSIAKFERVAKVRPLLDPWRGERFVRELDEQITAVAAAL